MLKNDLNPPRLGAAVDESHEASLQLQQAERLRMRGELDRARTICEPLVNRYPDYYGALHTLGLIFADKRMFPQALGCLVRACMLDPRSWKALTALSGVYLELNANEMAARTLEQAKQIKSDEPSISLTLAEAYRNEREYELARQAFEDAFRLDGGMSIASLGLARTCMDLGDYARAAEILDILVQRKAYSLPLLENLNQLPAQFLKHDVLALLEKVQHVAGTNKSEFDNARLFVRAAALHNAGKFDEAWRELVAGNLARWSVVEREAHDLRKTQQANLARVVNAKVKVAESSRSIPISLFILGPSRSGKSTLETLIASLPGVKRGYENPSMELSVRQTFQAAGLLTHRMFEMLPSRLDSECCAVYLNELQRRAGTAKVFTNTHPGRIHDAARVAAAIPNVRFLFVKRNIEDNLLRIFMKSYAAGHADSYQLKAARDGIIWYQQMIDLLIERLPGIARVIQYEDMVGDPAGTIRAAAELCGLPYESGSLPDIGDDRNCAESYLTRISAALEE